MFNIAGTDANLTGTKFVAITFTNSLFPVSPAMALQYDKEVVKIGSWPLKVNINSQGVNIPHCS